MLVLDGITNSTTAIKSDSYRMEPKIPKLSPYFFRKLQGQKPDR